MGVKIGMTAGEIIECPVKSDERGVLTIMDSGVGFPFIPQRVFYVHQPKGIRGAHAHRKTSQFLVVLSGSLQVSLDDGRHAARTEVSVPNLGILIPPMIWSEQFSFSIDCIYAVLACSPYDEHDYIRSRAEFDRLAG